MSIEVEVIHPVRFSEKQIRFIELMIYASGNFGENSKEGDILSTIKQSVIKHKKKLIEGRFRKPLTEGKTLSNIKDISKAGLRPSGPPGQGTPKAKKCLHLNIRFTGMGPDYCPDCNINVWPSNMINVLLDLLHVHPTH